MMHPSQVNTVIHSIDYKLRYEWHYRIEIGGIHSEEFIVSARVTVTSLSIRCIEKHQKQLRKSTETCVCGSVLSTAGEPKMMHPSQKLVTMSCLVLSTIYIYRERGSLITLYRSGMVVTAILTCDLVGMHRILHLLLETSVSIERNSWFCSLEKNIHKCLLLLLEFSL